jgi:acetyltransferase
VLAHADGAVIADARVIIDAAKPRRAEGHYAHMAIHPYPVELAGEVTLRDGSGVAVRAMRPEDAELEKRFVSGLSERSRYQRFMQHLSQLPPKMLERFTQLDYDRELALVALHPDRGEFIAVGRYAPNADGTTAEFALTVADAWQGKGLGRALLDRLCRAAADAGYQALYGHMIRGNHDMLDLARRLGFEESGRDADTVSMVLKLD